MSTSFPVGTMRVRFAGDTHVGMRRDHNEDCFHLPEGERLCLVADGMGGHASGETASRVAVSTVAGYYQATEAEATPTWPFPSDWGTRGPLKRLGAAIRLANLKILETARTDASLEGMGTTLVAAHFDADMVFLGHVGDSRIYRLREGVLEPLTEDHSLYNEYMKMGRGEVGGEGQFPQKNVLVRALGMREDVFVDLRHESLRIGDLFVLCTDGLCGTLESALLRAILLEEKDLDHACEKLIAAANDAGGPDNITVVLARVEPV